MLVEQFDTVKVRVFLCMVIEKLVRQTEFSNFTRWMPPSVISLALLRKHPRI